MAWAWCHQPNTNTSVSWSATDIYDKQYLYFVIHYRYTKKLSHELMIGLLRNSNNVKIYG